MERSKPFGRPGKDKAESVSENRRTAWDERAREFAEYTASAKYPEAFLRILNPRKSWTVFDMACGGGTIAVPLADKVRRITAVDFSPRMLEIVEQRCHMGGIANVKTIQGRWEDDWKSLGIGLHDVAIASRSLLGEMARDSIARLNRIATKAVYISVAVSPGPSDRQLLESVGRECNTRPDYIFYYNLLYEMGLYANVAFIPGSGRNLWESHEEALKDSRWMFPGMTDEEEGKVRAYLKEHLVPVNGGWRLPYSRNYSWAVLYWKKGGRGRR